MDKLLEALSAKGIDGSGMDGEQIRKVAKAVGLDPVDFLPRSVEIKQHTNKRHETNTFIVTDPYVVGRKEDGSARTVRGLFQRVETLDQVLADLTAAKGLLSAPESDEE